MALNFCTMGHSMGVTGYKTGPGQNEQGVFLTPKDLYCLGYNLFGSRLINHSSLLMNNGRKHKRLSEGRSQSNPS